MATYITRDLQCEVIYTYTDHIIYLLTTPPLVGDGSMRALYWYVTAGSLNWAGRHCKALGEVKYNIYIYISEYSEPLHTKLAWREHWICSMHYGSLLYRAQDGSRADFGTNRSKCASSLQR